MSKPALPHQAPHTDGPVGDIPADVLDQAIAWVVKLGANPADASGQARMRSELAAWRAANPRHDEAWRELQSAEQVFQDLPPAPAFIARRTLDVAAQQRVRTAERRKTLRRLGQGGLGVVLGALALRHLPWQEWGQDLGADHVTEAGEHRDVELPDGTRLKLNTDTAVSVRFTPDNRIVQLHHGEIFVSTGHDAAQADGPGRKRPFWVHTDTTRLQALGTEFIVHQMPEQTRLQVTEGRVAIHPSAESSSPTAVAQAGEAFLIDAEGRVTQAPGATEGLDATSWLDEALVVKQMRLDEVVAELGRYRQGWLHCDPAVAGLKVSGVFQTEDTDLALEALTRALPVKIKRRTRYWITLVPV